MSLRKVGLALENLISAVISKISLQTHQYNNHLNILAMPCSGLLIVWNQNDGAYTDPIS